MIVHVFNSSVVSGPETLAIPALRRLGLPVSIVFLRETRLGGRCDGPVEYARSLGHEVRTVDVRGRWDRRAFRALRVTLDSLGANVVHAHDVKASLYALKAARWRPGFGASLVSTHHGAAARYGRIRVYEELYVRLILPKFDLVLAVCESDRASLLRRGVPERLIRVHVNGVDRLDLAPADRPGARRGIRARWREAAGLAALDGAVLLGAVARLSPEKRHDRMLLALRAARAKLPGRDLRLVCFGVGAEEGPLKELAGELGLQGAVHWMGYSKTIGQEMAGFDLLLCLSDGEGIPINLIEAGWAGTPVLSTRVGGIPDLIPDSHAGFIVEKAWSDEQIGEAIAAAVADPEALSRVGARFRERVRERFSERAWLDGLRAAYGTLGP